VTVSEAPADGGPGEPVLLEVGGAAAPQPPVNGPPVVLAQDEGAVRVITLNRPERRNAVDIPLRVQLADAIEAAMGDDGVRAVVLTGAGGAFCAGGDISTMDPMTQEQARWRTELAQRVIRVMWAGTKPLLAAVEGPAFGAGLSIALACDRVLAAADARFGAAFARVGLAGDMGIFVSLPARLGPARARNFLMMAAQVDAPGALAMGLIDATAEPGGALAAAVSDARQLAAGPPLALAAIKSALGPAGWAAALDAEAEQQVALFGSEDFAEGVAAFRGRRTPQFRGR
jgi:enoyl-CoA hydratase/carnithine racemase